MKNLKTQFLFTLLLSIFFTACNENNKDKENTIELSDGTTINYDYNEETVVAVNNWSDYNSANDVLWNLEDKNYEVSIVSLENLDGAIANLQNSIPNSLKTEEVLEDISDVQEEYTTLIKERNEPQKNVNQNIEELVEKFDDLREELSETIEDYTE